MTTYLVTRHTGALDWFERNGVNADVVLPHLDADTIERGDVVIGTLPVNLASTVCANGGRYLHLSLQIPATLRSKELTADQLDECGATLEEYAIKLVE